MKAMVATRAGAALLLIGTLTAPRLVEAAPPTLTPGAYNVFAYVTSFNSIGNYCFPTVQNGFGLVASFYITYNGAGNAATATIQVPVNPTSTPGPYIALLSLPKTPTGTKTRWAGNYIERLLPVGGKLPAQIFNATLTPTSVFSFLGTMTLNGFSSGPNQMCDITFQYTAVFVGSVN